ncbi:5-deoxy-glucuronate isomerase [Actinotalea sp. M2MS4P-6]|uniref:5-deoxy-glucuronate isomerase n=1 Tax=Actinotalea sp. M2MS4P-6 TaxID=2983762 RepID=UPI0021E46A52|nr:5-deoxy-glucuronate isomerase [Actinotalea sp. M2MS4P-6]MCV2395026.1 5-deoxy-glucuronate isomerase [Actinotalea sp. M2MS4P-6]
MSDTERLVRRAGDPAAGEAVCAVTPESAGWGWSGLEVRELAAGDEWTVELDGREAVVVPLRGGAHLSVTGPEAAEIDLAGRPGVFAGPTDFAYLPVGSTVTLSGAGARVAVGTSRASRVLPLRHVPKEQVRVDLRGAGSCSRQVNNFTIATDVEVDHLLTCEVVTPGGNWSSYPPHKHDEHGEDERALEEIYYFEVADGPDGPGVGYHRTYGTPGRPIEVFAEVRTGDTALVPHGFHGPCMAAPGYDLYYLNVMAGPSEDGRWLAVDDPAVTWVRQTWETQQVDPRLPCPTPDPLGVDDDAPTH